MFKIDSVLTMNDPIHNAAVRFMVPFLPMYQNKDEHFTKFITKDFDEWLTKLEALLE